MAFASTWTSDLIPLPRMTNLSGRPGGDCPGGRARGSGEPDTVGSGSETGSTEESAVAMRRITYRARNGSLPARMPRSGPGPEDGLIAAFPLPLVPPSRSGRAQPVAIASARAA